MRAVLISIHPQYAAEIYAGTKEYELRKREPSVQPGTIMLIYESSPIMLVTGVVTYEGCIDSEPWRIYHYLHDRIGIDHQSFMQYYRTSRKAYAWILSNPRRFDVPFSLSVLGLKRPPQSYQFINIPDDLLSNI